MQMSASLLESLDRGSQAFTGFKSNCTLPFHSPSELQGPSAGSLLLSMGPGAVTGWDRKMRCPSANRAASLLRLTPRFVLFGMGQHKPPGRRILPLLDEGGKDGPHTQGTLSPQGQAHSPHCSSWLRAGLPMGHHDVVTE